MRELYPELNNNFSSFLETGSEHKIYFEECGNPGGIPVIFLHGGPGSGCNENHRRYFNPEKYRIILMDQRGCNRSSPQGQRNDNTTQDILNDIDTIRSDLNIEKWLLFGGSWGATLALLYAENFPNNVSGIILRGAFLARHEDLNWFLDGVTKIFPDYWHEFSEIYPNNNLIQHIHDDVFSNDKAKQLKAAIAWATWAGRIVTSSITSEYVLETDDKQKLINETRIEMHYANNRYFIKENQIVDNLSNIPDIPVTLIHGRQDLTCLPESSYLLHRSLSNSKLMLLPETGHLGSETAMINALVTTTDNFIDLLS